MLDKGRMRFKEVRAADGFQRSLSTASILEIIWEELAVISRLQQKHLILIFPVFYTHLMKIKKIKN